MSVRIDQEQPSDLFPGGETLRTPPGGNSAELVTVLKDGVLVGYERRLNFLTGTNLTLAVTDDPTNGKVDITVDEGADAVQTSTLLDGVVHTDTLLGVVARGDIIVGNATPKWSRKGVTNNAVLRADSSGDPGWAVLANGQLLIGSTGATPVVAALTAGANITITNAAGAITIAAAGASGGASPYWSCREYHSPNGPGNNRIVDGSWFDIPGATNPGLNFSLISPDPIQIERLRYCADPNGSFEFGLHNHLIAIWARIQIVVTGTPSFNWKVPNIDDNFGIYRQTLTNGTGSIKPSGAGTSTLFSSGAGDNKANVNDMLIFDGGDNLGEALNISAVNSDTSLSFTNASNAGTTSNRAYKFLRKVYQASNKTANDPINVTGVESLTAGTHVYHLFANNSGLQAAFNWVTDMLSVAGISWLALTAENWTPR